MATSKTLTPTNVTIQIPEFTDQPDQRVNSNCIDKEADAINSLNTAIGTLNTNLTSTKQDIAIVLSASNVAPRNITKGQYVIGNDGNLYTVTSDVSYNQSCENKMSFVSGGGLNALKSDISSKFETWTGGTKQLAADGQTWLCGAQQIVSASAGDASAAICLFSKTGSYYRLSPIVKSSNAAFIYNQNGVFGVQFDNSYNNSAMFAIRLI